MFKDMSIKMKLISSFTVITLLFLLLAGYNILGVTKSSGGFTNYREMAKDTVLSSRVQANMLMVRMNVKEYISTPSQKEIEQFTHYYNTTKKYVKKALIEIEEPSRHTLVKQMSNEFTQYKEKFLKVVDFMDQRNLVYGNLVKNGSEIETLLTSVMITADIDENLRASIDTGSAIRTLLLARLYTMKFLDSNSESDNKRVLKEFKRLEEQLSDIKEELFNRTRIEKLSRATKLLKEYEIDVAKIVNIVNSRNKLIDKLNISGLKIGKIAEDIKLSIKKEQDTIGPEVAELNSSILNISIIIAVIVLLIVILSALVIPREISIQLEKFQNGLLGFFKYLNRETNKIEMLDDSSKNEIGTMSKVVNENINKTKEGIEEDRKFIDNTVAILSEFEQGDLSQRITSEVNNPALNDLKKVLNSMGQNLEANINEILNVLEEYTSYTYQNKVETSNVKHHLFKLSDGVNNLGSSITIMLKEEKNIGETLESSSTELLENVNTLNDVSNEAAASLEETAAALEEITTTIVSNTENVVEMASFAEKVITSVDEGNSLANKTTKSMDEINEQVTSINEAITVIDQIAFQTNILSLNAAVEAATAGEAGKGFAVVAQEVRNLAARSAEAAREIKLLVESATLKANDGKNIADKMIYGYTDLNDNIKKTIELINQVEAASKEQQCGIEQINDAVSTQDQQTQQIASAANKTYNIAVDTSNISKTIVSNVEKKSF